MKKIILSLVLISFLALPVLAAAAEPPGPPEMTGTQTMEVITKIVNWLFAFLLVFAVIFIIIAGFQFVTAGGDPEKVKTARQSVIYAIIGLAIAFLARGITALVERIVTGMD